MSLGYDPELPAGYQDADIEMLELAERANQDYEKAFAGACMTCGTKGGWTDYDNYGNRTGWSVCFDCGGSGEIF